MKKKNKPKKLSVDTLMEFESDFWFLPSLQLCFPTREALIEFAIDHGCDYHNMLHYVSTDFSIYDDEELIV